MSAQLDQSKRLASMVTIENIRLVEATAKTRIRSSNEVPDGDFNIGTTAGVNNPLKDGIFFVVADIDATIVSEKDRKDDPAVRIWARFELQYKLPKKFTASLDELNAFAEINGIFNAWPYWREFIQNTSCRMNLPPLTIPIFRVADEIKQLKQEKESVDEKAKKK